MAGIWIQPWRWLLAMSLVALSLPLSAVQAQSQDELNPERWSSPFLEADRDAFTPATTTVGEGIKLLESSYAFVDNRHDADINSAPETLFRYGLTDRIELRVGFNYEAGGGGNVVTANESSEGLLGQGVGYESYTLYGAKIGATRQRGWIPESSFIVESFTPTAGHETATKPVITYTGGWKFAGGWELDSAIRYAMGNEREHEIFARWAPSVVLRYSPTDKLQVHAEYFGVYSQGLEHDTTRAFLSPGGRYLITPNLELGLRLGWGISYDSANFFLNTGFGWRF